jgi:hypothetical protein
VTALNAIRAGARLTAAMAQGAAPLSAYKTSANQSAQSVTSSTTLVSDNALFLAVQANAVYYFELVIAYQGSSSGNIKLAWSVPSSATMGYSVYGDSGGSATAAPWATQASTTALTAAGATSPVGATLCGTIATAGTGGTVQLQWAQNASNGTATTVLAASVLSAWQIQ